MFILASMAAWIAACVIANPAEALDYSAFTAADWDEPGEGWGRTVPLLGSWDLLSGLGAYMTDLHAAILEQLTKQNELLVSLLDQSKKQSATGAKLHWESERSRRVLDNIRMVGMADTLTEVRDAISARQLGLLETVKTLRDENLSFARYGDGELKMMVRIDFNAKFQHNSPALQESLTDTLLNPASNLLLGMPHSFVDLHWTGVWAEIWQMIRPYIGHAERYGNSHSSRPVIFHTHGDEAVEAWSQVWAGRRALIITGEGSRFDMVDPLFGTLAGYSFLYTRPTNAFTDIPRIVEEASRHAADLVLISLGPAGTVLANEFAKRGKQALDIGHLSSSYTNVIEGGAFPESTPLVRT